MHHTSHTTRVSFFALLLFAALAVLLVIGCAAPAQPSAAAPNRAPQPTAAPAQSNPVQPSPANTAGADDSGIYTPINAAPLDHKIIKNAQLALIVHNTAAGVMQITGIASDAGGYVVGSRTFADGDRSAAQISIAVPVDRFEEAVNRVRSIALKIDQDTTSSAEVTEEFVDLESRLTNLDATAERLRNLMNRADTITETLTVNTELVRIEQEMEQIKGRMNALNARSALSTIAVDLKEPEPTRAAETPTATPTPLVWRPDETLQAATAVQTNLFQGLANIVIWFTVVLLPFLIAALLVGLALRWFANQLRRRHIL